MLRKKDDAIFHPVTEKFTYTTTTGKVIELPYIENITLSTIEEIRNSTGEPDEALFDAVAGKDAKKLRMGMTLGDWYTIFEQWNEQSAVSLGE